jgi:hypothetical protein
VPKLGDETGTVLPNDTFSGFDSQASLWENVDATLASDAGSGLLSTPFANGLDGPDWTTNLLSPGDFGGSAGANSLLGPYDPKGSGPTPTMQRDSSGSRPPGLGGGPPGLIAPSLQSELNSFSGSDPSSLWGDSSAFQPAAGTNTNHSPGLPDVSSFSSGNSPTLARSNNKGASNQPPPGLGGGWGAFGDDTQSSPTNPNASTDPFAAFGAGDAFNSGDGPGYANAGPAFSSLGDLPSIPYSNDTGIWGASEGGTFGDLDWAKPEEKKMTADTAEWTPGGGW